MSRDTALIVCATVLGVGALVAITVLALRDKVDPAAALTSIGAVVAVAGVALGRLSGQAPT